MSFSARIAQNTTAEIVYETRGAIWNRIVKRHVPLVMENMLQETPDEFKTHWNFPNCVGATDGKQCLSVAHKAPVLSFIIINPTSPYTKQ